MESSPSGNGKFRGCLALSGAARKQEQCLEKPVLKRVVEGFYDHCAAFNLRYVPYRSVTERVSLQTFAKDFAVLFCFAMTSLVVLLTILSRIAMHIWLLFSNAGEWIKKKMRQKKCLPDALPCKMQSFSGQESKEPRLAQLLLRVIDAILTYVISEHEIKVHLSEASYTKPDCCK